MMTNVRGRTREHCSEMMLWRPLLLKCVLVQMIPHTLVCGPPGTHIGFIYRVLQKHVE